MGKLKPFKPTPNQVKRIARQPLLSGVLLIHLYTQEIAGEGYDAGATVKSDTVEVVEFQIGDDGTMLDMDGEPLVFRHPDNGCEVSYEVTAVEAKERKTNEQLALL